MAFPQRLQVCMILIVGVLLNGCESQIQCIQTGTCTCKFNDQLGTVVNFGTIGLRNGQPRFPFGSYGAPGPFVYAFNPCYSFSAGSCKDVVSCQQFTPDSTFFDLGDPEPTSWTTLPEGPIQVTYSATQAQDVRNTVVSYTCDPTAIDNPSLEVGPEGPTKTYNMVLNTCAACSPAIPGCPTKVPPAPAGGLTGGGIICILFTVLVLVYIIGGIIFQKFARGATGKEVIPNYSFWSDFPGLIKDGFLLMISPCRRGGYNDLST